MIDHGRRRWLGWGGMALAGPLAEWLADLAWRSQGELRACPMHPEVQSRQPGTCPKCGMKLIPPPAPPVYGCVMHPEVTSPNPGECPRCRMRLTRAGEVEARDYLVRIETAPAAPVAGERLQLRFTVWHPVTGRPVTGFNIQHDMPFHLFIVSQDLASFEHLHPALQRDGSLIVETVLPKPGDYRIFCDFFPEGGMPQVTHHHLVTAGHRGDLVGAGARLTPDRAAAGRLVRSVDGTRFELTFQPASIYAGMACELQYLILDEASGRPVTDLHPYLAAWGHTLILSEDATEYLHSHPTRMLPEGLSREAQRALVGGSEVVFETFFPRAGRYRIWSQFQRGERLITVPFNIEISRL